MGIMTMPSVLIIGAGNMGSSLVKGLFRSPAGKESAISVYDISPERLDRITTEFPVKTLTLDGKRVKVDFQAVVLCIKPQDLPAVASSFNGRIASDTLVISILAGTPLETIATALNHSGPMVRAMPNIPATIGLAATAMCANAHCSDAHRELAMQIFNAVGDAHWTKESLMDAVTGLSGSGPAYIYMVIEALTDGGVKMGIPRKLSEQLAAQTVLGAASLVKSSGVHPAILRDQVTTPGGTTISAIHELEAHGLRAMLIDRYRARCPFAGGRVSAGASRSIDAIRESGKAAPPLNPQVDVII
jgi:pyrroline-5-carboxylate reductase